MLEMSGFDTEEVAQMNWLRPTVVAHFRDMAKATIVALAMLVIPIFLAVFLGEITRIFYSLPNSHLPSLIFYFFGVAVSLIFYRYVTIRIFAGIYCDLPRDNILPSIADGIFIGATPILGGTILLYFGGYLKIVNGNFELDDLFIFSFLVGPVIEEVFFRGVLLRYTSKIYGKIWGIAISSFAFGIGHIGNQNADFWSTMNIAIGSGVLFGLLYLAAKNLWVPIGAHVGWNFCEGNFLGSPNSGATISGLLRTTSIDSKFIAGGNFGLEGSIVVTLICIALSLLLARRIKISGDPSF